MLKDQAALKILASSNCDLPALIVYLPVNKIPNKLASNIPNNILRHQPFYSFDSFLIVSLTPFIN